jgi:hypothetical protein
LILQKGIESVCSERTHQDAQGTAEGCVNNDSARERVVIQEQSSFSTAPINRSIANGLRM